MQRLLSSDQFDVSLLDQVINAVYCATNEQERAEAQDVALRFKSDPNSWTKVDSILETSRSDFTKAFALQILDDLIKFRWKLLPPDQRNAIRQYLCTIALKASSSDPLLQANKVLLARVNQCIVEVCKQDWPANWPNFITDIVSASKTSESICENNLRILMLLSEEIFDFSAGAITQEKVKSLRDSLNKEFNLIFELFLFSGMQSQNLNVLESMLQCLLRYITWVPIGYIFETQLLEMLVLKLFPVLNLSRSVLRCLIEVASLKNIPGKYSERLELMFSGTLSQISKYIPPSVDLTVAYEKFSDSEKEFIAGISIFLCNFLANHRNIIEKDSSANVLFEGYNYLLKISSVNNSEIFQTCLDYWTHFARALHTEKKTNSAGILHSPLKLDVKPNFSAKYNPVLHQVRELFVKKMAKPEEFIIVEDENGQLIRERAPNSETVALYKQMREGLILLYQLDYEDTHNIMRKNLAKIFEGNSDWKWAQLNSLGWAIGSIASNANMTQSETAFFISVIKDLLTFIEKSKGKSNKAIVASNIMYILGQYPSFLKIYYKFLTTVVNKLFEFMHETHPGVQDMACDTFLKIATKCKIDLAIPKEGEPAYILYIAKDLPNIIGDLENQQIQTFYEAAGHIVGVVPENERNSVLEKIMSQPNSNWRDIMTQANRDTSILTRQHVVRQLTHVIKINRNTCLSCGVSFTPQFEKIYSDVLMTFKFYTEKMSEHVASVGPSATQNSLIKEMRIVKREILNLVMTFISVQKNPKFVLESVLPAILPTVLDDYRRALPEARDPEVFLLLTQIVSTCKHDVASEIPKYLDSIFECTISAISKNQTDFPEIRSGFYRFIRAITHSCYHALKSLQPDQFSLIIQSLLFSMKHTTFDTSEFGLLALHDIVEKVNSGGDLNFTNNFYKNYFLILVREILGLMTDTFHKAGFQHQSKILLLLITGVEKSLCTIPLYEQFSAGNSLGNDVGNLNRLFIREFLTNSIKTAFPNLSMQIICDLVKKLCDIPKISDFRNVLTDFLVQRNEFFGQDNSQLFHTQPNNEEMKNQ